MRQGVFELSMEAYRAEHGINHSSLKHIARSPAHLREHQANPPESTRDQILGSIVHKSVFEPNDLIGSCHVKPENYQSHKTAEWKKWNGNATECKQWLSEHSDKPVISTSDFDSVLAMSKAVFKHPAAAQALKQGKPELSLFAEDPDTGLQIKARPDWLSGNALVDLKKCQDASPAGFARSIANFSYDSAAAFYLDIAGWLNLGKEFFLFIAVEDVPPYGVAVYELDEESIQVGRSKYRRWLNQYLECTVANKWPAYPSDRQVISLPQWAAKQENNMALEYAARPALVA